MKTPRSFRRLASFFSASAVIAVAIVPSGAHAKDKSPLILKPSTHWKLEFNEHACKLSRQFGEGDNLSALYIEKYEPSDRLTVAVASKTTPSFRRRGKVPENTQIAFGPSGKANFHRLKLGELGKYGTAIYSKSARLFSHPNSAGSSDDDVEPAQDESETGDAPPVYQYTSTPEQEAEIEWVQLWIPNKPELILQFGSLGKPMKALRLCMDDLIASWGLDVEEQRNAKSRPQPIGNVGRWVTTNDYPKSSYLKGAVGEVNFRVIVDQSGKAESCVIQATTQPGEFERAVCNAISRRARFNPAIGADGKPIRSFYTNSVHFKLPGV